MKMRLIASLILMSTFLILLAACGQNNTLQASRSPTPVTDPTATRVIYVITFISSTTYTQAHDVLKGLGIETGQWSCIPRVEKVGKVASDTSAVLTTPPPSQDTPEFYDRTHQLLAGYWEPLTPQQVEQLKSSSQVVSVTSIPLVSC